MAYTPSDKILKNYADVLVNFALGGGKGIKKGEVVRVSASESAKPLFMAVCNAIVDAGGHVMSNYGPDDEQGDKRRNISVSRYFYEHASEAQIKHFPAKYLKGVIEEMDDCALWHAGDGQGSGSIGKRILATNYQGMFFG